MDKEQVKQALTDLGVTKMKVSNGNIQIRCLFPDRHPREDARPSAGIKYDDISMYNCFSCGTKGRFLFLLRGLNREVYEKYKNTEDLSVLKTEIETVNYDREADKRVLDGFGKDMTKVKMYLKGRGLDWKLLMKDFQFYTTTSFIYIACYVDGKFKGVVGRNYIDDSMRYNMLEVKKDFLFNDGAKKSSVVLCEGIFDAFAIYPVCRNVVASLGSIAKAQTELLYQKRSVRIMTDNDRQGRNVADYLYRDLRRKGVGCEVVRYEGKDPAEVSVSQIRKALSVNHLYEGV